MGKKPAQYIFFILVGITIYLFITLIIYFYSLRAGNNGVNVILFGGGDDGTFYYNQAINFAKGLPYEVTSIHIIFYGIIFKVFNTENAIFLRLYNFTGFVLLVTITLFLLRKLASQKNYFLESGILIVALLLFYPSLILNTTLSLYRDIWIYFFFLWSIYLFSNIFLEKNKYPKLINLIFLFFSMTMLFGYRKYALMSFLIGSSIYLILKHNNKNINLKQATIYLIAGFTFFYIFFRNFKVPFVGLSFNDVLLYRQSFIDIYAGGSQMNISLEQSNVILFYVYYLYSFLSNVVGPFPWQVNSISTLAIMVTEGVIFIIVIIILFKNRKGFTDFDKYLLIQSIVWFMLISISNDNFGAGSRLRIVGWLPLLILFAKYFGSSINLNRVKKE